MTIWRKAEKFDYMGSKVVRWLGDRGSKMLTLRLRHGEPSNFAIHNWRRVSNGAGYYRLVKEANRPTQKKALASAVAYMRRN